MTRPVVLWPTLILIGTFLTLVTVLIGNWIGGDGFPLVLQTAGCPPPGIALSTSCLLAIAYDWLGFGLDILFYTAIEYGLLLAYAKYRSRGEEVERRHSDMLSQRNPQ